MKLFKASLFLSIIPAITIMLLVVYGRLELVEALFFILVIVFGATFFAKPYFDDLTSLTQYVKKLALDRVAEAPPLGFLSNVGELSAVVNNLHQSWQSNKLQLESALAESKILFDSLPDILMMLDENRKIIRANNAALISLGDKIINNNVTSIIENEELASAIDQAMLSGKGESIEISIKKPNVTIDYIVKIENFPIRSDKGAIATILVLHDITEAKKSRQMTKDFVANASHEIRTPLTSLIGFIETLRTIGKDDREAHEKFLSIMSEQAERMAVLVNDLLSLSKIELLENTILTEKVDIPIIIEGSIKNVQWNAEDKNMPIRCEIEEGLAPTTGDQNELTQVFTNLVSNAVKYGEENTPIEVKVQRYVHEDSKNYISIMVKNYGEGIPEKDIPRLTERFYRVDKARSRKIGGSGLGLAIVKHILNHHRAELQIQSNYKKDATFTVLLPAV